MNEIALKDDAETGDLALFQEATIFDVQRFEQVNRVATVMARASLIPDHLKGANYDVTFGNCFMISNLAATWGLDPFAVAQASSLVFSKIVLEGKLVRAVIKKFLGFDLDYAWFGLPGDMDRVCYVSDRPLVVENEELDTHGEPLSQDQIEALMKRDDWRITKGTLAKWCTKTKSGDINDNWAKDEEKMFRERGAREWCREFSPGLMLGVYTPDEFDEVEQTSRSNRARDVTPARNPLLDQTDQNTEAQSASPDKQTMGGRKDDKSPASAKPSVGGTDGGSGIAGSGTRALPNTTGERSQIEDEDRTSENADPQGPARSIPRFVFEEFCGALARIKQTPSLPKAKDEFFRGKGLKPTDKERSLFQNIYQAHEDRIKSNLDVAKVRADVAAWIAEDVPEDNL
jgi:hypothetical protein